MLAHHGPLALALALVLGCHAQQIEASDSPEPAAPTGSVVTPMHPELHRYIESLLVDIDTLSDERREPLDALARFVIEARAAGRPARLIFICTHNSRRSHMSQLWAATAAAWWGIEGVETYSGGTEASAFNPRAVAAMRRAGFVIEDGASDDNPRYEISFGPEAPVMIAFSKTWDDPGNPSEDFAAIMTCTQADEACPYVRGASLRIAVPFEDPKQADGTPDEAAAYDERARQIAVEMLYLFRSVAAAS